MMEVLEPLLLRMSTEELLKEFRSLCQTVTRDDVIRRAIRIQLTPVRVGLESNHSRLIDPKYKEERYGKLVSMLVSHLTSPMTDLQILSYGSELNISVKPKQQCKREILTMLVGSSKESQKNMKRESKNIF